jgi:hypothetical protein
MNDLLHTRANHRVAQEVSHDEKDRCERHHAQGGEDDPTKKVEVVDQVMETHLADRRGIAATAGHGNDSWLSRCWGLRGILLHGATLFGQIEFDGNQGIPTTGFATL